MEDMKNNRVAILTTFYSVDPAYSLCNVVEDQLRMFVEVGDYKIILIVDEALNIESLKGIWRHPNITYKKIPGVSRSNEGNLPDNYREQVDKVYESLKEILKDVKVCIGHDITLQCAHLIHSLACRRLASERDDLFWLHWAHSATSPFIRCSDPEAAEKIKPKFPNSFMCYPNDWDKKRVALNYKYELDEVKCVHHPSDFVSLMFGEEIDVKEIPNITPEAAEWISRKINYPITLSKELVKEFDILNADVISVYPCRLDRGKQVEWNIKTMAAIKKLGRTVRMIVFDFHSTGGDKVVYRNELKQIGREWGLTEKELVFISEWKENTSLHVPREVIMNLKKISDFHMHPSTSETYSLVVQESMMWRNMCILNHHTPYMRDIYGSKNVLYEPMSSAVNCLDGEDGSTTININNAEKHFENIAKKILYFIEISNPVISEWRFIRQNRSIEKVFRNELEPIIYRENLKPLI